MTKGKYGKIWCLNHCLPVEYFNVSDEKELKKGFNWIYSRPIYVKDKNIKGDKIDMRLYLLQEIKSKYFKNLIEQRTN